MHWCSYRFALPITGGFVGACIGGMTIIVLKDYDPMLTLIGTGIGVGGGILMTLAEDIRRRYCVKPLPVAHPVEPVQNVYFVYQFNTEELPDTNDYMLEKDLSKVKIKVFDSGKT